MVLFKRKFMIVEYTMLKNQIIVSVLVLFSSCFYLFITSAKFENTIRLIQKKDAIIIITLVIIYSLINFIHFASFYKYQDNVRLDQINQSITIVVDSPKPLKSFYYSTSYLKGKYNIDVFDKVGKHLNIDDKDSKLGYAPYFRWNMIDLSHESNVHTISLNLQDGLCNLTQIALVDQNNNIINDYQIISNFNANTDSLNLLRSNYAPNTDDNYTTSTVFDEIYYATSAYQYLNNISPDVWVHPQLGLLLIALGMIVFGVSAFGFRIVVSLITIAMLPVIYYFAKNMFKSTRIAVLATLLLMVEFMHFVMGRFASLEPFVTLFLLLEYYFLYRYLDARVNGIDYKKASRNLLYAGVYFGLAMSSKWNALYSAIMIILVIVYAELIRNKTTPIGTLKIFINAMLQFVLIPLLIYTLMYIPYANINNFENLWFRVYQLQGWMLNFNLGLTNTTHPYASNYWSWPLDIKPLSVYYWQKLPWASSVVVMGNPAIFWVFIPLIGYLIYSVIKDKKDYIALFLLSGMLIQYLPYALIHRVSFIYYFYSVTPLLILAICYVLNKLVQSPKTYLHAMAYTYVVIAIILFVIFYPALSGIAFFRDYVVHVLLWFPTWNF